MSSPFGGIDHVGYVVSDLDLAARFAIDVLGFEAIAERAGNLGDPDGDAMTRRFGVHPRATGVYRFFKASNLAIEFLAWESPDRVPTTARNCDAGGRHLAIAVADMPAALERIAAFPGTEIRETNERGYIYVKTPFGLEVQLIPTAGATK